MTATVDPAIEQALTVADSRAAPVVSRPVSPWLLPAGFAVVLALGLATFAGLHPNATPGDAATNGLPTARLPPSSSAALPPAPALTPIAPVPINDPPVVDRAPVMPLPIAAQTTQRSVPTTPALIIDLSTGDKAADAANATRVDSAAGADKLSGNEAFAARLNRNRTETVGIDHLTSTSKVVPQGTIVAGILETAINSDLPGQVRAVVSRDVPGFDGTTVLIPRGSRLIGQYSSGVALGQSRAFIIWTRLLRSDGVSVQLASAGTDALGTAGLAGKVNTHFLRRFGAATLLSVVTAGLEYVANKGGGTQVLVGSTSQANQLASIALQREIDIPPTIKVLQGTPIRVFVARDLDFGEPTDKRP